MDQVFLGNKVAYDLHQDLGTAGVPQGEGHDVPKP